MQQSPREPDNTQEHSADKPLPGTGRGAHAFEVIRDKKAVRKWADLSLIKSLTTVRVIGA